MLCIYWLDIILLCRIIFWQIIRRKTRYSYETFKRIRNKIEKGGNKAEVETPSYLITDEDDLLDDISDWLSDEYGFCHD